MRLALMGQKLGHKVFIVIEQLSEIDVLLQVADELGVTPIGGRAHQARVARLRAVEGERRREVEVRAQLPRSSCRRSTSCAPRTGSTSSS